MANVVLMTAVLLAAASFVSYTAQDIAAAGYGQNRANDVCLAAPFACQSPHLMAYIAAGLTGLWNLMKFVSALRD
jgi:hypothetical protein